MGLLGKLKVIGNSEIQERLTTDQKDYEKKTVHRQKFLLKQHLWNQLKLLLW